MQEPIGELLKRVVMLMERSAAQLLKEAESPLTYERFYLLSVLKYIEPTTQHRLATIMDYSDAAISRMVTRLAHDGYVTQEIDPNHARKHIVQITDLGHIVLCSATELLENSLHDDLQSTGIDITRYYKDTVTLGNYLRSSIQKNAYNDSKNKKGSD